MAALVKQSLVDQIYTKLRDEIVNQEISWGEKLNVSELQTRFDISSTPIREALNRLQKEGLVEYRNNIGANVIEVGEKDVLEIQEVNLTLDCAAIRYAMKTEKYEEIAEELAEQIKGYDGAKDDKERTAFVEAFINVFYKYAANSRLINMSQLIKGQQSMLRSAYRKQRSGPSEMKDHRRICEAVLERDVEDAIKALEENYKKGTEILLTAVCSENK